MTIPFVPSLQNCVLLMSSCSWQTKLHLENAMIKFLLELSPATPAFRLHKLNSIWVHSSKPAASKLSKRMKLWPLNLLVKNCCRCFQQKCSKESRRSTISGRPWWNVTNIWDYCALSWRLIEPIIPKPISVKSTNNLSWLEGSFDGKVNTIILLNCSLKMFQPQWNSLRFSRLLGTW